MKGACIGAGIGTILLFFLYTRLSIYRSKGTIDIHLHDTYFVLGYTAVILFVVLFLGTFFFLGGLLGARFKSRLFWVLAVVFLAIDTYYLVDVYKLVQDTEIVQQKE
ncbi:hypothetical protein HRG84_23310 [Flavisolibacter sp. BT320]|nr:hypothetical protein [Flavisolibacter longurius]